MSYTEAADRPGRRRAPSPAVECRRAERRSELLEAAVRAIRREGPDTSMDAIAAEAGVTKPILYRHFGDRGGLCRAIAERQFEGMHEAARALLGKEPDLGRLLVGAIDGQLAFMERDAAVFHFLSRRAATDDPGLQGALNHFHARCAESITALVLARPEKRGADPELVALWVRGLIGAVTAVGEWWTETRAVSRADVVAHLEDLFRGRMFEGEG